MSAAPGSSPDPTTSGVQAGPSQKQVARRATEAALLDAATRMLLEAPGRDLLSSLKPVDVVRRAEPARTTGAFYNIWPTHAQFRKALLAHLLSLDRFRADETTRQVLAEHLAAPEFDLAETIRIAANMNFDGLKSEPAFVVEHSLWTDQGANPDVRERLRGLYGDITDSLTPLYEGILARTGRRMRSPYTIHSLGVVLAALVEGLQIRWAVDPDSVPDDAGAPPGLSDVLDARTQGRTDAEHGADHPAEQLAGGQWSLFASVTHLLFMSMTEPAP